MDSETRLHIGERWGVSRLLTTAGEYELPSRWMIVFYYAGDFLPISASEVLALDRQRARFCACECDIICISGDSVADHLAWSFNLRNHNKGRDIGFPLASDTDFKIAESIGLSRSEKAVIILDGEGICRGIHIYPKDIGVNFTEAEREVLALRTASVQEGLTPADWVPGDDILDMPPKTLSEASRFVSDKNAAGCRCVDWYLCYKSDTGMRKGRSIQ